jgi:hypothetical protein
MNSAQPAIPIRTSSKRAKTFSSDGDEESLIKRRDDLNQVIRSSRKKLKPQQSFDTRYVKILPNMAQLLIYTLKVLGAAEGDK